MPISCAVRAAALAVLALIASLPTSHATPPDTHQGAAATRTAPQGAVRLRDVAAAAGLRFTYEQSPTPEKHYIESAPAGLAVFDYNGDGRPDLFFRTGRRARGSRSAAPSTGIACSATRAACASPT